jgi:hypothetical protein
MILGFTGQPPIPLNHPGKKTKNLRFFQRAQKILKTSKNAILESVITNIYFIFWFYIVVVVKITGWVVEGCGWLRGVGGWPVNPSKALSRELGGANQEDYKYA